MHTVDGPDAGTSLLAHLATFPRPVRDRGGEYERRDRVLSVMRVDDHTVAGEVQGASLYAVELRRRGEKWRDTCSCPLGGGCKHVVALALRWLALPPAAGASAGPPKPTFRQKWEPVLAERLGRPLTSTESSFLGRLANTFHNFSHTGWLRPDDVVRLGFTTDQTRRYATLYADWWDTPPRDPLELWNYIAYDIESSGGTVPEFLRPITDTASVRRGVAQRLRDQAIERWRERFADVAVHAATTPPASDDFEPEPLEIRLRLEPENWILETRPGADAAWKPAPRALADRLVRDDPGALVRFVLSPAAAAFIGICQQHYRRTYFSSFTPSQILARELLQKLLAHRLARTLVVGPFGRPLEFSAERLRWRLAAGTPGAEEYVLALHLPDGRPLPPSAIHLPLSPSQYLHDGVLYLGPPALDGGTAASAVVPAEVLEDPGVLGLLRKLDTQFPPEIEQRFLTVPVRATLECALELDASDNELLTVSLLASCDDPPLRQEWRPAGWSGGEEVGGTAADGKIVVFDYGVADRAAQHLGALKVSYDHFRRAWTRRATRSFAEEFLMWREGLPSEVEVRADGELASLFGAPIRARIDVELLESAAHRDWFDLALVLKPEDTTLTREEISLLLKARGKLVRIPGKGWRRLTVQLDDNTAAALGEAGFDREALASAALSGERHRFHALQLTHGALGETLPQQQAEALRARAREITRPTAAALPAGLKAELRPYQREGFQFLVFLSSNGLGGVLADDMGLGKTVQTLAWLLWLAERQPARKPLHALVVCPKSVVGNWEAEAAKFAPSLRVVRYSPADTDSIEGALKSGPAIVVANYAQLRLNAAFFTGRRWHAVVLDEGQFIKTPTARVAQVARELPGEHRVVLTGTPIENRLFDLWSLFAFALPGLLGSQTAFKRHYNQEDPLALPRLRSRVRHFLLRRTKAQVAADLPPRTEEDVTVELEGEQAKLYQAELKRARAQLLNVETAKQLDKARFNILASLLRLRQICCHPALISPAHRAVESAKLEELLERVEELRDEGHQVLVFSQFVTMLELIREKLVAAGIGHLMLTGQTEDREALVSQFQSDKQHTVFLLSLKAAGFGLNLTAASYVILYDPWWNPAVEAQAIDRTHRIGQQVPVIAYRLIARGTIEEKIRALQHEKAALAGAIVQEESLASVLDLDSLRQILS